VAHREVPTGQLVAGGQIVCRDHDRHARRRRGGVGPGLGRTEQREQHAATGDQQAGPPADARQVPAQSKHAVTLGSAGHAKRRLGRSLWTSGRRVDTGPGVVGPQGQAEAACAGALLDDDELELDVELLDDDEDFAGVVEDDEDDSVDDFGLSAARLSVR
jgi:hypothetical protein